jgi:hypothetical protein
MSGARTKSSRRQFILATSAQALLVGQSGATFAQATIEPTKAEIDAVRRIFGKFYNVRELPTVFFDVFDRKLDLSLGLIDESAREEIQQFVSRAVVHATEIAKEGLSQTQLDMVALNSILLQNAIIAISTDNKGRVNITKGVTATASKSLCPSFPFC